MNINDFKTPGQYLKALLDAREWSQRVLAIILEIDESLLTKIINNNRNIDAKTALLLGEVFEVDPEDFLSLQKKYDLEKAPGCRTCKTRTYFWRFTDLQYDKARMDTS